MTTTDLSVALGDLLAICAHGDRLPPTLTAMRTDRAHAALMFGWLLTQIEAHCPYALDLDDIHRLRSEYRRMVEGRHCDIFTLRVFMRANAILPKEVRL